MEPNTVYFVAFSDGVVKVGRTGNFRQRLHTLRSQAKRRGAVDTHTWSMEHASARIAEHILLRIARAQFERPWGAEFFTCSDFTTFVKRMAYRLGTDYDIPIANAMRWSLESLPNSPRP